MYDPNNEIGNILRLSIFYLKVVLVLVKAQFDNSLRYYLEEMVKYR